MASQEKDYPYKQKLYLVLKTLGVEDIKNLMEEDSPYLVAVVLEIRKAAELGSQLYLHKRRAE